MISITTIRIAAIVVEVLCLISLGIMVGKIIKEIKNHDGKNRLSGK